MSKVAMLRENQFYCICSRCLSYTSLCKLIAAFKNSTLGEAEDLSKKKNLESLYCGFGKSKRIKVEKGCVCNECEIYKKHDLDKKYYCRVTDGK